MGKRAFITGICGQDGSYLAELLLSEEYEVFGLMRRHSNAECQDHRIQHIEAQIQTWYGDITDAASVRAVIKECKPHFVFNLAAQSHVGLSSVIPEYTIEANCMGMFNVLEACREIVPQVHFYQASSSEIFGNSIDSDGYQREDTIKIPASPYGCSKLFGFNLTHHYRKAYNMFASNGILFNHESPRRTSTFITAKVVKAAVAIKQGKASVLELGNLEPSRDWGHSKDYVKAMVLILNHSIPDDFVIATGETHTIRELCQYVFGQLGLEYEHFVVQNPRYMRVEELVRLRGDSTKARIILRWEPNYTFETLLDEMISHEWERVMGRAGNQTGCGYDIP